ncbi:hypothetical protein V9T40_014317 [Parthenolecanium corni]|uniref:Pre-mRNA-splicing factor SLU7 n=1 Tax=Parthenolecanium corni TaxID=536013 RepID=A0AAN9XXE2_9HEMI
MSLMNKNIVVSEVLKTKSEINEDDEPKKKSREDWRKAKELEEARKAGTAPAAVDEEGRDINPHIPQYISSTPWYYGSKGPTLKHQRIQDDTIPKFSGLNEWYKRGITETPVSGKYRKGACENCGAMGHNKKDCLERPRKIAAKYINKQLAADDFVQPTLVQTYDGKRDRWAGYDPSQHKAIVEQYQRIEEAKRTLKAEKLNKSVADNEKEGEEEEEEEGGDDEEDEDKYVDNFDMPGTKVDSKQRITVRNLRIREDTAKYLRNLDPNSAFYDPKTRSMRDNPHKGKDPEEVDYAGENFVRFTGDTQKHATAQLFAWEAYEKGVDVHLLAEPTKLELLKREYEEKKEEFKHKVQEKVLDKYGGEEHLKVPPKELLFAQTEEYREYTRSGKLVHGEEKLPVKSRYEEDVYPLNHKSIWGSYWENGQWGYKCCRSLIRNSYCIGEAGKTLASTSSSM